MAASDRLAAFSPRWLTTEDKANPAEAPTRCEDEDSEDDVLLLAAADILDKAVATGASNMPAGQAVTQPDINNLPAAPQ